MNLERFELPVAPGIALRTRTPADAAELFALTDANRAYLRQWLPWLDNNTLVEHSRRHIEHCLSQQEHWTGLTLAITENGRIIGVVGYNEIDRANRAGFIGYWLSQSHMGRGIMTHSCRALVEFGFTQLNLNRQGIGAAVENLASRGVAERLGFSLEGIERDAEWLYDHFVDHAFYAITQKAWDAMKRSRLSPSKKLVTSRLATPADCRLLAELNYQLIQAEGHRNPMTPLELESRMADFLSNGYRAVLFESAGQVAAYALYRETEKEIYLRQLFVIPEIRRQGIGRAAIEILRNQIWIKQKRLTVEVLASNFPGIAFWRAMGYRDYSIMLEIMPQT